MRTLAAALTARPIEPHPAQVDRAMRLTYAQAMLGAVFTASTGGMFLIGFAIRLGANNVWLGLLACIPQIMVVAQFASSAAIERGLSRKGITEIFSYVIPICWMLIALIPVVAHKLSMPGRMALLISVIGLAGLGSNIMTNARQSWIGELIPLNRQGRFFGATAMFAGIVASVFAVIEGRFLDVIKSFGLIGFLVLFFFGSAFALASAALNHPQPDCPLPENDNALSYKDMLREVGRNKPLIRLGFAHAVLALGGISGPFVTAYCLRDVGMSFFGLGILNSLAMLAGLLSARLCGKLVDKIGCRPVVLLALFCIVPLPAIWLFIPPDSARLAYVLLPINFIGGGMAGSALSVGITTMLYKLASPVGRSVQFAAYWTFVLLCGAPMPFLGGLLVDGLHRFDSRIDLRLLFYIPSVFWLVAIVLFAQMKESGSESLRVVMRRTFGLTTS